MSDLQPDSLEALDRLISEQSSYLTQVDREIAKWTQFQTDYHHLQTRLSTLPDRLTYDCMVPFGKLAFLPGRIVHSNEILVLLGENYFVERSCKQAMEIIDRRLKNIDENLKKHQQEKDLFHQQKQYTSEFLEDRTKFFEIKEPAEEEEERRSSKNRRAKLTDEEIREERRRLQERAMKFNESKSKHVHFQDTAMEVDSDDDNDEEEEDEIPHQQFQKILIHHTKTEDVPVGDPSPAVFAHPGEIGTRPKVSEPVVAFTGKTIERSASTHIEPPPAKRISKFKASRQ